MQLAFVHTPEDRLYFGSSARKRSLIITIDAKAAIIKPRYITHLSAISRVMAVSSHQSVAFAIELMISMELKYTIRCPGKSSAAWPEEMYASVSHRTDTQQLLAVLLVNKPANIPGCKYGNHE
jgi:hypothetical protein